MQGIRIHHEFVVLNSVKYNNKLLVTFLSVIFITSKQKLPFKSKPKRHM